MKEEINQIESLEKEINRLEGGDIEINVSAGSELHQEIKDMNRHKLKGSLFF